MKVLHWEKNYARKNTYSRDTLLRDARINHKAGRREGGKERKAPAETENGVQVGVQEKRRKGKENWGFHGLKLCDSSKNDLKVLCLFFPLTLLLWLLRLVAFFATWITLRTLPTVVSQKKKKRLLAFRKKKKELLRKQQKCHVGFPFASWALKKSKRIKFCLFQR